MNCLDFIYCILEKYENNKNEIINKYISGNFYTSKPQSDTTCPAYRLMWTNIINQNKPSQHFCSVSISLSLQYFSPQQYFQSLCSSGLHWTGHTLAWEEMTWQWWQCYKVTTPCSAASWSPSPWWGRCPRSSDPAAGWATPPQPSDNS